MKPPISSKLRFREYKKDARLRREMEKAGLETPVQTDYRGRDRTPVRWKKPTQGYIRRYLQWLRPQRAALLGVLSLALLGVAFNVAKPMLSAQIIDKAVLATDVPQEGRIERLTFYGGALVILTLFTVGTNMIRSLWVSSLNARIVFRLRQYLHEHLMRLSLADLSTLKSGGVISRLSGDVDSATGLVQAAILSPLVAGVQAIAAIAILLTWNWRLAVATAAVAPPLVIIHMLWVRRVRPLYRAVRDDRAAVDGRVAETFSGIRVVRAFRREPRETHDYTVGHHTAIRKSLYARLLQTFVGSGWELLLPGISVVILWYGGYMVVTSEGGPAPVTVGQLFAFQWYVFLLLNPILQIVNAMNTTQQSLAAMERVFDLLDKPVDKPDPPDAIDAPTQVREMRFEGVGFAYRENTPVLTDVNLVVPGGTVVALVGPSGAGKTTLTDLIARFHDPVEGAILLNGLDLRRYKLHSFRSLLGIVQQDVFLFDGTVRDNIAYGRRGASDAEVVEAARRANADQFIREMSEGYDTIIGERGMKLSGGQRQRLSIARAILADPRILILDEATSSLDTENERLIQAALADLYAGRTTFVIAHRLSTIIHADQIVVLDAGRVIETGSHTDLMSRGGRYAQMVDRQRQGFDLINSDAPWH